MGDFGLLKQGWKWFQSQKQAFAGTRVAESSTRDNLAFLVDRHWPMVSSSCVRLGRLALILLLHWRDCAVKGFWSLASLGTATLFVILWSCFLSFTSTPCLVYALLGLGAAGVAIRFLGSTSGLFIVGSFAILIMWICGNLWITGMLLIVGGYMFSLNHARLLILISTAYAVYFVNVRAGWLGVFLSLNLAFISNDLLSKLLQGYDGASENTHFEEQKESEPVVEDFPGDCECPSPTSEAENVTPSKSSCKTSVTPNVLNVQKDAPSSKVVKAESTSADEMRRIMNSANHYDALGFPRHKNIDPLILKKEYRRIAVLVHPDKNMGNPLASESFKKLQCAYEILSDLTKKKTYDDQLRKEESRRIFQNSHATSRPDGLDFHSEESRHIECTKCGNSHIWICTTKSKASARWCQDCSQYHPVKDGEGWVEYRCSRIPSSPQKVEIPRAFVCAESKIFDVSEWAICQGMVCKPNTHKPSFHVNMKTVHRSNPTRYPWSLDAEMNPEDDEFELWFQQALASGLFTDSPKRRKSWSPFKISQKGSRSWRRSP